MTSRITDKKEEILKGGMDLVSVYRKYPVLAAEDLLDIDLAVPQQRILNDLWFKNYIAISAGRGCGKCITGNALIPTNKGFVEIGNLGNKLNPLSDLEMTVQGIDGPEKTSQWYYDGEQEVFSIKTSRGYSLTGTLDHKITVMDETGNLIWKRLEDIQEGDYVALDRSNKVWSEKDLCSPEEALLLGLLIGDGCFRGSESHLGFTNADKDVIDRYSTLISSLYGKNPAITKDLDNAAWEVKAYGKKLWDKLSSLGIRNGDYSGDKDVPSSILGSGKKIIAAFLQGLFETDGGCESNASVSYCSKSAKLAKQVHLLLLAFGVSSTLRIKKVKYKGEYRDYSVISFSSTDLEIFNKEIGFLSARKIKLLESISSKNRNTNLDVIPHQKDIFFKMWDKTRGFLSYQERERLKRYKYGYENPSYSSLLKEIKKYPFDDELKTHLINIHQKNYFFDKVESKVKGFEQVYDFVVPGTHSFSGNGFINHNTFIAAIFASLWGMLYPGQKIGLLAPSFRQAKNMFAEVERIWSRSPIFQEATQSRPIRGSDRCSLTFKQAGRNSPSIIEAIPTGDGQKIRGARYYVIIVDEFAFFPVDIFSSAIVPMGATNANPMENVRRIRKQDELILRGIAEESDFDSMISNKVVMLSSAYYQFNHMYQTIQEHREKIRLGDTRYGLQNISYRDMPKGFLSKENIEDAKSRLPGVQFRMEYEAIWEADSSGIFKASLIDKCQRLASHTVDTGGKPGSQYVLGVDPARSSDASGFCLIELGSPCKVVAAWEHYKVPYPELAKIVMDICDNYNVVAVAMDAGAGGGGTALKDILFVEATFGAKRLLDYGDDSTQHMSGRRILHMIHPSPTTIAESVYATVNMMEHGNIAFPLRPSTFPFSGAELEAKEELYDTVDDMIKQLMLIEITQNKAGTAHFDVPSGGGHAGQKKDLYSAFILAAKKSYDIFMMVDQPKTILEVGIIEERTTYSPINSNYNNSNDVLPAPVNSWAYRKTFNPR